MVLASFAFWTVLLTVGFLLYVGLAAHAAGPKAAAGKPSRPVVLTIEPGELRARPEYGCPITYRWQAQPMAKDCTVFVRVLDKDGKVVVQEDHAPPAPTSQWSGAVEYTRTLFLPRWAPWGKQSVPGPGEGRYTIHVGLADKDERQELSAGPGVTADGQGGYQVGVLVVDRDAPIPELGPKTLDLTGYRLTFNEEFTEPLSVSPWGPCGPGGSRWIAHTPYAGDFGDAAFIDPVPGFPFTIDNGILRIEARKDEAIAASDQWKRTWGAGLLSSADANGNGFAQKYGYFEMRAKFPEGPGTWPAFWLLGLPALRNKTDPSIVNIEIDILEQYGHWPNKLCTAIHQWNRANRAASISAGKNFLVCGMTEGFHTYGAMVTEEFIAFYYDGVELRREKTPECAKVPLYLLVNLTLGPGWPLDKTPSPSYMYVDYVRAYSR